MKLFFYPSPLFQRGWQETATLWRDACRGSQTGRVYGCIVDTGIAPRPHTVEKFSLRHIRYSTVYSVRSVVKRRLPFLLHVCLKKNQTTPRPSEHPPVMGGKMSKRLGGIKRLQIQNHFMAFQQVPRCR